MSNLYATAVLDSTEDTLMHFGIIGMHWGIRRYQPYGEGGYDPDHIGKNIGAAARQAGKRVKRKIDEGLERLNEANDKLGETIKRTGNSIISPTDRRTIAEAGKMFGEVFKDSARKKISDIDRRATEMGYRVLTSDKFSSVMGSTLMRNSKLKRAASEFGAYFAIKGGVESAGKRRRADGPQSSLGGKSLNYRVLGDSTRSQTLEDRELYGPTEYEKFVSKQGHALGKVGRNSLAYRQASWTPGADHAKINDWFETFSRSPEISKALGIDKTRQDALERGVKLSPMSSRQYPTHQQRMKELSEGRALLNSPAFMENGGYQDTYGYKFLTKSQQARLPAINQTPVSRVPKASSTESVEALMRRLGIA